MNKSYSDSDYLLNTREYVWNSMQITNCLSAILFFKIMSDKPKIHVVIQLGLLGEFFQIMQDYGSLLRITNALHSVILLEHL